MRARLGFKTLIVTCGLMLPNSCAHPEKGRMFKNEHKPEPDVATCALSENKLDVTYRNVTGTYRFSSGDGVRKEFGPRIIMCEVDTPVVIYNPETHALLVLPAVGQIIVATQAQMPIEIKRFSLEE